MNADWLIIDGYNLLHQVPEFSELMNSDIHLARQRLVRLVEKTAQRMAPQTTIVFDGKESGQDTSLTTRHLEVYFSPANLSADTIIERLVCRYENPEKILVVTSDHAEHETVASAGACVMSSQEFTAECDRDSRKTTPKQTRPGEEPKLGDLFPDGL
jgi:predicted RNA-binding protein with PIN domain